MRKQPRDGRADYQYPDRLATLLGAPRQCAGPLIRALLLIPEHRVRPVTARRRNTLPPPLSLRGLALLRIAPTDGTQRILIGRECDHVAALLLVPLRLHRHRLHPVPVGDDGAHRLPPKKPLMRDAELARRLQFAPERDITRDAPNDFGRRAAASPTFNANTAFLKS